MMSLFQRVKPFLLSLSLLVFLNVLVKPVWIFWIDREVQNRAGFSDYGVYFALINLSMMFSFLLDLGITAFVNREIAANNSEATSLIQKALSYKLFLSFFYTGFLLFIAYTTGVVNIQMLLLLTLLQILLSFLLFFRAGLTAAGLYWQDAVLSVLDKFLIIFIAGIWLLMHQDEKVDILHFIWLQLLTISITLLASYLLIKNNISFSFFQFPKLEKEMFISGLPFALNYFFMTVLLRGDGFLVERLSSAYDAGVYAAAFRLVDTVNMMGFLFSVFLVSYIAREGIHQEASFIIRITRALLLLPAVLIALIGWFYASEVNAILYASSSEQTAEVIQILLLCMPALAIVHIYGSVLTATGEIRLFRNISGIWALSLLLVDIALIPTYGTIAAAWTAVVCQSIYAFIVMYFAISKKGSKLFFADIVLISGIGLILWICLNS